MSGKDIISTINNKSTIDKAIIEQYMLERDKYKIKLVFYFIRGHGGIGDYIKFFICALKMCIKNKYKLYCFLNEDYIEKYIKLIYKDLYITHAQLVNDSIRYVSIKSFENIVPNKYNVINPGIFYHEADINSYYTNVENIFYFSDEIISNSRKILQPNITDYISMHLRLGDKYLETDPSNVLCKDDTRKYNDKKIHEYIEKNKDKNIIFFCDNNNYKLKLKEKYNNIILTNAEIGHTSLKNTTAQQILDAITEFYIITQSNIICGASYSGFSIIASYFKNTPIVKLYE